MQRLSAISCASSIPLLFWLILVGLISATALSTSSYGVAEYRVMKGKLLKADTGHPLARVKVEVGDATDSQSVFGIVSHRVFASGKTDEQGRFSIAIPIPRSSKGPSTRSRFCSCYLEIRIIAVSC